MSALNMLHHSGLAALLPQVARDPGLADLRLRLSTRPSAAAHRFSILDAAKPAALAALTYADARPTMLLVNRLARARQIAEELTTWLGETRDIYVFPELDALPYERLAPGPEHLFDRLRTMLALSTWNGKQEPPSAERRSPMPGPQQSALSTQHSPGPQHSALSTQHLPPPFVVVTARAVMDHLMAPETCRASTAEISVGERIRPDQLIARWVRAGYEPVTVVERPGEFARRGGIIDIYPCGGVAGYAHPPDGAATGGADPGAHQPSAFRIELWGNDVDSIRSLDPSTQRSVASVRTLTIGPAHEVLPDQALLAAHPLDTLQLDHLLPQVRDAIENELRMLAESQTFAQIDWYRGVFGTASILDYLPENGLLIVDEPGSIAGTTRELQRQAEQLSVDLLERGESPGHLPQPYWSWDDVEPRLGRRGIQRLDLVLDPDALDSSFTYAPTYSGRLPDLIRDAGRADAQRLVIVSHQAARLADLLTEQGVAFTSAPATDSTPVLLHSSLGEGWMNRTIGLTLLTDREIFGWAKVRSATRRLGVSARERFLSDLEVDELVVHVDHGIGRYRGLVRIADRVTGLEREYLDIEYGDNGRLRVPAEHADRVGRYIGAGEAAPSLTKLGSGEWQRTKQRIRNAVHRIARELVELYATREIAEAPGLGPDTPWQMELEASFPFVETPDQLQAALEVKEDLERARPMDRLLVGDVGYGKTEVALRAAFKAVNAGRQVAILVPTTVLAQQHFNTFRERLAPFPVRVEMLSRFLTDRQAREVVQGVKDGPVDIVIGTHRLLQKDVAFKDLGLVVIDEEQRFGVMHKDRFKQLRTEVHVLSLSATPIPRTLHLSLVGVRDLSTIQTPPEERLPIRTYVTEHDDHLVREAILRELDRGGQVYYVSNRVYSIGMVASRLAALVPEARIAIGHGQMGDEELEETMLRFANGDADVLVCTTIIEAGLDLPNVNTIVVTNAHQFGLSQLYQLRGRVGRASNRAYAYFLYDRDQQLTEIAEKRLRAIFEATELGAGFRIALKDLEIRGAGNLLGVEQHGHISAVGFNLYCRLLGEAVEQLKALRDLALESDGLGERVLQGAIQEWRAATINLPTSASLPDNYVTDESARLSLYQRISSLRDGPALGELMSELEDRFGPLPEPALNLFYLVSLKLDATAAGVDEILIDGDDVVVRFREQRSFDTIGLGRALGVRIQARANQIRFPRGRGSEWMPLIRQLVDTLAAPAPNLEPSLTASSSS